MLTFQADAPDMASLRFVGLKTRSLHSYQRALLHFFEWMDDESIRMPSRASQLDETLASFLEHLWLDDFNITYAGHTLSALRRFYPQLRYRLPVARQFFSNWKSIHAPRQAVPMPANVALALAGVAIAVNEHCLALAILLGFTAFLRTGEIAGLRLSHMQVNEASGQIILALPATKTSKNKMESVAVSDPLLASLAAYVLASPRQPHLLGVSTNQFRQQLKLLLDVLQLRDANFTAYSLRRGGASHAFATGRHFDQLLVAGRWQSVKTARQYLDSGRAALIQLQFQPQCLSLISKFQHRASIFCEQLRQKRTS